MKKGEKSEANLREKTRDANNSKEWEKKKQRRPDALKQKPAIKGHTQTAKSS